MNKTVTKINKETRLENILALKRAVYNNSFEDLDTENSEWRGAHVIIRSSESKTDDNKFGDIHVITKHSKTLSKLFHYVKENIMEARDFYLYGFMALLANDFIRNFGDGKNPNYLLEYVTSGISFYYQFRGCTDMFNLMRFFLSSNITDEEIMGIL